jgi:hypothetical protein
MIYRPHQDHASFFPLPTLRTSVPGILSDWQVYHHPKTQRTMLSLILRALDRLAGMCQFLADTRASPPPLMSDELTFSRGHAPAPGPVSGLRHVPTDS